MYIIVIVMATDIICVCLMYYAFTILRLRKLLQFTNYCSTYQSLVTSLDDTVQWRRSSQNEFMKNDVLRVRLALLIESQAARSLLTASDMMQVNVLEAVYIYTVRR